MKIKIRLLAILRIIFSRNFILIDQIKEPLNDSEKRICRLLRRTDYSDESDFLTLKMSIMANFKVTEIEDKHHNL